MTIKREIRPRPTFASRHVALYLFAYGVVGGVSIFGASGMASRASWYGAFSIVLYGAFMLGVLRHLQRLHERSLGVEPEPPQPATLHPVQAVVMDVWTQTGERSLSRAQRTSRVPLHVWQCAAELARAGERITRAALGIGGSLYKVMRDELAAMQFVGADGDLTADGIAWLAASQFDAPTSPTAPSATQSGRSGPVRSVNTRVPPEPDRGNEPGWGRLAASLPDVPPWAGEVVIGVLCFALTTALLHQIDAARGQQAAVSAAIVALLVGSVLAAAGVVTRHDTSR